MKNFYYNHIKVEISGKNINYFIKKMHKNKINIYNIEKKNDKIIVIIDYDNYDTLLKIKSYYDVEIIEYLGYHKIKKNIILNKYLIILTLIGFLILFFLTRLTFNIEIVTNDIKMKENLMNELKLNGIYKFSFIKSYDDLEKIKNNILNKYKDNIEWLEIERVGTKYILKYEPRISNNNVKDNKIYNIVAKKNARILNLDVESGQILKNINEYVNSNDIIVSSDIKLNEEVKNEISANGKVYGEVWYKVNVKYPKNYYEEKMTGRKYQTYSISFLNYKYLFHKNTYKYKKTNTKKIIKNNTLPISLNSEIIEEFVIKDSKNYQDKALKLGLDEISKKLNYDEYIMDYYILNENNKGNIYEVNIFVRVLENIGEYKEKEVLEDGEI